MFEWKPDFETCMERVRAFWEREIADRPLVYLTYQKDTQIPYIGKPYRNHREKWLDFDTRIENEIRRMQNTVHAGDALPIAWPNLGPEIVSAMCGCGYEFGETTTWSIPCIRNWENDSDHAVFREDGEYFILLNDFTKRLIQASKGRFIVGYTDMHGGGDHLAALRDPQELCIDLLDNPEWVKRKLSDSYRDFYQIFNHFHLLLSEAGMPSTTWLSLPADEGKYGVVSNDFSCMISSAMFDEFFLPGIREECRFYHRSIYHLDGPGSLPHLESLLAIPELDAVQWVPGAGNEGFVRWRHVYRRIQEAGKSMQILIRPNELADVMDTLDPEGIWLCVHEVKNQDQARNILDQVSRWR